MWDPETERDRITNELAVTWARAQHLVWHSPEWDAAVETIDDLERDLGRLNRLSPQGDYLRILVDVAC